MESVANRPSFEEVLDAIKNFEQTDRSHPRAVERIGVTIPGEIQTKDGRNVPIRLRDLSPAGIGFFHYGSIDTGEVTVNLTVNSYRVALNWCVQCHGDLYMSGGPILKTSSITNVDAIQQSEINHSSNQGVIKHID